MGISRRSVLTAGVCGVMAGAIVLNPSTVHLRSASLTPAFSYSAYSLGTGDAHAETTPEAVRRAVEFIESITPETAQPTSVPDPGSSTATVPTPTPRLAEDVDAQNAASGVIDSVYAFTRYWANYASLDLGPWLINWIPFGYLVSDQIDIWYRAFVLPVVDSFVYQFLDPIVNQPLNPGVWWNGAWAIADAALKGIVSGFSQEIDYVFSLGWLPFPLPPLPGAAAPEAGMGQTGDAALRMSLAAASGTALTTPPDGVGAQPDEPGSPAGGTVPAPTDPAPEEPAATETAAPEEDPGAIDGSATADPTPAPTTAIPNPDNPAPTVPAATPDPATDTQDGDGTLAGQDGAPEQGDTTSGDTQDGGTAPGDDGEVQPGNADDPADTTETPAATAEPSTTTGTDTTADSGSASSGATGSADGGDAGN